MHSLKIYSWSASISSAVSSSGDGTRSSPIQNLGGIGRRSSASDADVAGSVKGSGTEPPRSREEHETKSREIPALAAIRVAFISGKGVAKNLEVSRSFSSAYPESLI